MFKKNQFEWIVPLFILISGTLYYLQVSSLSKPEVNLILIEPIFFLLVAFILFYFVREIYKARTNRKKAIKENHAVQTDEAENEPDENNNIKKIIVFFLLTTLFVFTMEYIGFVISSFIYMISLMLYLKVKSYKQIIMIPIFTILLLYFSFELWLNIRLPQGFFGI